MTTLHLSDLPDTVVLAPWSVSESGDEYTSVVREVFSTHRLRITPQDAKVEIDRRLVEMQLLPETGRALKADYQKAQKKCRRFVEADGI